MRIIIKKKLIQIIFKIIIKTIMLIIHQIATIKKIILFQMNQILMTLVVIQMFKVKMK